MKLGKKELFVLLFLRVMCINHELHMYMYVRVKFALLRFRYRNGENEDNESNRWYAPSCVIIPGRECYVYI